MLPLYFFMLSTWYSSTSYHAAYYHRQVPFRMPEVVDDVHSGCAAPPEFPFGSVIRVTRDRDCLNRASEFDGVSVIVTVLDRLADPSVQIIDLWPAPASRLGFGSSFGDHDVGCLHVHVKVLFNPVVDFQERPWLFYKGE